jgi:hypothetical protein
MKRILNTLHAYSKEIRDLQSSERAAFHAMHLMLDFALRFRPVLGRQLQRIFNDSYRRAGNRISKEIGRKNAKTARDAKALADLREQALQFNKRAADIEAQCALLADTKTEVPCRRDSATVMALKAENALLRAKLFNVSSKRRV